MSKLGELSEAVESDDNLEILKTHRRMVSSKLDSDDLEDREWTQLSSLFRQLCADIIKVEGSRSKVSVEEETAMDEDDELRKLVRR